MTNPIRQAAESVGGLTALATKLGVKPPTVHQWAAGDRPVPPAHCLSIERLTKGAVSRRALRPDDYWLIWPDLPEPKAAAKKLAKPAA